MPKQKQDIIKTKWTKNCPNCTKLQQYKTKNYLQACIKKNTQCNSCANKNNNIGRKHTEETKQKMSQSSTGKNNGMYGNGKLLEGKNNGMYGKTHSSETKNKMKLKAIGRTHSKETIQKIIKNSPRLSGNKNPWYGKKHSQQTLKIMSNNSKLWHENNDHPMLGKRHSKKTIQKMKDSFTPERLLEMRLSRLNQIKNRYGQISPNYNPEACKIIEQYGKDHGYNFQHAENGGEVCIGGFYPDGLDEDKKTIIEVDEKHHFISGKLKIKDIKRQKYLEHLGYEVIRIKYND